MHPHDSPYNDHNSAPQAFMTQSTSLVTFTGVQKTYDGHTLVVRDLNLEIQKGNSFLCWVRRVRARPPR